MLLYELIFGCLALSSSTREERCKNSTFLGIFTACTSDSEFLTKTATYLKYLECYVHTT